MSRCECVQLRAAYCYHPSMMLASSHTGAEMSAGSSFRLQGEASRSGPLSQGRRCSRPGEPSDGRSCGTCIQVLQQALSATKLQPSCQVRQEQGHGPLLLDMLFPSTRRDLAWIRSVSMVLLSVSFSLGAL